MKTILALILAFSLQPSAFAQPPSANASASLTVAWTPETNPAVTNYTIWFGTNSGNYTASLATGTNAIGTLTNLTLGVTYYVAVNAQGNGLSSPFSSEISSTMATIPGAPVGVHAVSIIYNP